MKIRGFSKQTESRLIRLYKFLKKEGKRAEGNSSSTRDHRALLQAEYRVWLILFDAGVDYE